MAVIATWLHWFMVAFFVLFGVWLLAARSSFASARAFVRPPCGDGPFAQRLRDAVARRERLENLPGASMAASVGVASLAAAALAVTTAIPTTLLYAMVTVVLALTVAGAYLRLRQAGGQRVASLRARRRETVVPAWFSAMSAVAAVSPLTFIDVAPLPAVLVAAAALTIALLGVRAVQLPALLTGADPAIEEYVDDRLRALRAVNLFATATAPPYVFEAITFTVSVVQHGALVPLHLAAMLVALVALLASTTFQIVLMRRGPGAPDLERWAQHGV